MIDVIIPAFKPDKGLDVLIEKLNNQTIKPDRIIIMNTEKQFYDRENFENVEIYHIKKEEFSHGRTRNQGVLKSNADICVLMTQDAEPVNNRLIEELIKPVNGDVAVSYARQLAREDSSYVEKLTREFNYPDKEEIKALKDVERLQIKAFFCSNVCAAYKREVFDKLGGFVDRTIFNEDMLYAHKAIYAGYSIAYAAKATVYHSHNYTGKQQFKRNFDNGVSHAQYKEIFAGIKQESEGLRMVKSIVRQLSKNGHKREIIPYIWVTGCKYLGFKLGCRYEKLPKCIVKKCTSDRTYFNSHI